MKCPHCGYWNKASFPRCFSCGEPLPQGPAARAQEKRWVREMKDAQPDKQYLRYDETLLPGDQPEELDASEVKTNAQTELAESLDELNARRRRGAEYLAAMRERAREAQEALSNAPVIQPMPEELDEEALFSSAPPTPAAPVEPIGRRQRRRVAQYMNAVKPGSVPDSEQETVQPEAPSPHTQRGSAPYNDPQMQPQYVFDDDDPNAPVLYDGYEQPANEKDIGPYTDYVFPRINDGNAVNTYSAFPNGSRGYVSRRRRRMWPRVLALSVLGVALAVGSYAGFSYFSQQINDGYTGGQQSTQTTISETEIDGLPGHVITIAGREGAQIYIRELQTSYIVTGGVATIALADYTWYENEENLTSETMDVTLTPFLKSGEGEQIALTPITYTIDVPLSPVTLVKPESAYAGVSTSIFEIRLHVEKGSRVIIDGENVSSLITTNGYVSKNVQVLPTGDNIFQISVRSQYCRENNMEVTLNRAPQEIPLELDGDTESESTSKRQMMTLYGTTLPGATITIESPHTALTVSATAPTATPFSPNAPQATATPEPTGMPSEDGVDSVVTDATGKFSFQALFKNIGDNVITIRASYPGMEDSVIMHTVYWIPDADVYTRRAWPLNEADYTDLVNNIAIRKGQVYVCKGKIVRMISDSPQLAIMNTSPIEGGEQLVLLENNTKTIWSVGTEYRVYADAFGLYDTMPRLTARYTYIVPVATPEPTVTPDVGK